VAGVASRVEISRGGRSLLYLSKKPLSSEFVGEPEVGVVEYVRHRGGRVAC
jgi:hypothetical protein